VSGGFPVTLPFFVPSGPVLPPFDNPGYEIAGATPGEAASWTAVAVSSVERLAVFGALVPPDEWEGFENGWANDAYIFAFDPLTDLSPPLLDTSVSEGEAVEDFEEGWGSNETYAFELGSAEAALFDLGAVDHDGFEGWDLTYAFVLGSATAALFDSGANEFEAFTGWAPGYDFSLGGATAAAFDGASPENVEDFEETYTERQIAVDPATDFFTLTSHGFLNGDKVTFSLVGSGAMPAGLNPTFVYFVVNKTTHTFQVALTSGGAAVDVLDTGNGSTYVARDATLYWNIEP